MKPGDKVWYTIPDDEPRQWTISSLFDTNSEGLIACLSRPDDTRNLGIDRCNAPIGKLKHVKERDL